MFVRSLIAGVSVIVGCGAAPLVGQSFDRGLLGSSALLPRDSIPILYNEIRGWMSQQTSGIGVEAAMALREDLYRVIQSVVWYVTEDEGTADLAANDIAAEMFDLATYLGVYGAGLVARDLAESPDLDLVPPLLPDPPFNLTYSRPSFRLESVGGWSIAFPSYFMPWMIAKSPPEAGAHEVIALSTPHGFHTVAPRTSQATILVVGSQSGPLSDFLAEWEQRLGLESAEPCPTDDWPLDLVRHKCGPMPGGGHVEMGAISSDWGNLLFVYSGLDGTFRSNRPHLLSLIETFEWR